MIAFHGDPSIKKKYLARVLAHRKADQLIQDYDYFKDGKGCAVGCTIHSRRHNAYETELGIPTVLAYLEDSIFEGLPVKEAKMWPTQFLSAIEPGADLSQVWPKFAIWLLTDKKEGVINYATAEGTRTCVREVARLYGYIIEGKTVTEDVWRRVRDSIHISDLSKYANVNDCVKDASFYAAYVEVGSASSDFAAEAAALLRVSHDAFPLTLDRRKDPLQEQAYVKQAKKLLSLLKSAK